MAHDADNLSIGHSVAIARRQCHADAGAHIDAVTVDLIRSADCVDDALAQGLGLGAVAHLGLDDGEFIATEPRDQITVPHAAQQPLADLLQ